MYWDDTRCAVSVKFSEPTTDALFCVPNSDPHVPLIKPKKKKWQILGPWVRACNSATGWEATSDPNVDFNSVLGVHRKCFPAVVNAVRTVELIPEARGKRADKFSDWRRDRGFSRPAWKTVLNCVADVADIPELQQVPSHLWARTKYDVGLIKGVEPVVITPKSSYRPCQNQYPLKRKQLRG